jgi:hypothetical protein
MADWAFKDETEGLIPRKIGLALKDAYKNLKKKPGAWGDTHYDIVALAELGLYAVGDKINTVERESGTGIGANTYVLKDAGSAGARPDEGGPITHIGDDGLYLKALSLNGIYVEQFTTFEEARSFANASKKTLFVDSQYEVSTTIQLYTNDKLCIKAGAQIGPATSFSGGILINIGATTGAHVEKVRIFGEGRLFGDNRVNRGIEFVKCRFSSVKDIDLDQFVLSNIRLGRDTADAASYEINIHGINCLNKEVVNNASSAGVIYENATDCYFTDSVIIGYRTGVSVLSGCGSINMSRIHVWGRSSHGAMRIGFLLNGGSRLSQCDSDTPYDNLPTPLGELSGYSISANVTLMQCRCFISNGATKTDAEIDNKIVALNLLSNANVQTMQFECTGGTATRRFKSRTGGTLTNLNELQPINGPTDNFVTAP